MAMTPTIKTLDEVASRIKAICDEFVADTVRCKTNYDAKLEALSAEIEASPDLDQDAVGSIVFGQLKKMMAEVAKAVG
ncbi:hypothetical protein EV128_12266 [Rhizobium azibense]|nr:hypothetical protein EV128_12266 [Rhizobium azibense]